MLRQIDSIRDDLKKRLSEYRYEHSIRVAEMARKLASFYGENEEDAYLAGLVHDVAKEFTEEENLYWLERYGLSKELLYSKFRRVVHSEVGSVVVKELYGVDDRIAQAVLYHTVGNVQMSLLDKIVFVADKIELGKDYPGILEERKMAFQDIDETLILCLVNNQKKLESNGKEMHPDSLVLLNNLRDKSNIVSNLKS